MFCRNCGKELTGTPEICLGCGAKPLAGTSFCNGCGAPTTPLTEICMKCGVRLAKQVEKGRSGILVAGGILSIIAGVIGLLWGITWVIAWATYGYIWGGIDNVFEDTGIFFAVVLVSILLGITGIVGGAYALKRKRFMLAVIGGISAFLGTIASGFIGAAIGIGAIVLITVSKDDFK